VGKETIRQKQTKESVCNVRVMYNLPCHSCEYCDKCEERKDRDPFYADKICVEKEM
jgi:hypothetical protein